MTLSLIRYRDANTFLFETKELLEKLELQHTFPLWAASAIAEQQPDRFYCGAVWDANHDLVFALVAYDDGLAFPTQIMPGHTEHTQAAIDMVIKDLAAAPVSIRGLHGYDPSLTITKNRMGGERHFHLKYGFWSYRLERKDLLWSARAQTLAACGKLRRATILELPLLVDWMTAFICEVDGIIRTSSQAPPVDVVWDQCVKELVDQNAFFWTCDLHGGVPVGMLWRRRPRKHGVSLGYVFTPPDLRHQGYGTTMVTSYCDQMLDKYSYVTLVANEKQDKCDNMYTRIGFQFVDRAAQYSKVEHPA